MRSNQVMNFTLKFEFQSANDIKKMLSSGGWATNVKENKTVEFRANEDSIVSAEIFSALSLLFP